ncbi:endolytic transglycosylase MltG [Brevundimonas sp. M20]|uniref:endolytic transglycosylase MltG n=1 Tax=Brevundimonas sp. M20 TaxID=2591463 RepID=UPI001146F4D9|nr:endolytic transglycosylase MltG [Brevundimonas sp. M20]QDH73115.1 endolytic transglycosylase MltG [Brevundimonas sp. M20]
MFRRSVEKGASGRKTAFLAATATFSLFLIAALVAAWSVFYAPGPSARQGETTIVSLPSGAGVSAIAANLKAAGVIRSTDMFKAAASITGADRKLRAGEYEVPSGASLRQVLVLLVSGKVVRHYVTLPEGWSSAQAVDILMRQPILTGAVNEVPEEGTLWPDTYEVSRGETRASVIARMQRARDENLTRLWATRGPNSVVRSLDEAVILASIVEKETGVAAERPRVAAVFSNRLRMGMRLESDPTIVYGITKGRPLGRGLRRSEIDRHTDWNTYQIDGLPPTPIANPGRDAIAAVLNPPVSEDVFFVADGTGGHAFARTYDEHLANVARWRAIERRRQGLPPEPAAPVVPQAVPEGVPPGVEVPPGAQVIRVPQQPAAAR